MPLEARRRLLPSSSSWTCPRRVNPLFAVVVVVRLHVLTLGVLSLHPPTLLFPCHSFFQASPLLPGLYLLHPVSLGPTSTVRNGLDRSNIGTLLPLFSPCSTLPRRTHFQLGVRAQRTSLQYLYSLSHSLSALLAVVRPDVIQRMRHARSASHPPQRLHHRPRRPSVLHDGVCSRWWNICLVLRRQHIPAIMARQRSQGYADSLPSFLSLNQSDPIPLALF